MIRIKETILALVLGVFVGGSVLAMAIPSGTVAAKPPLTAKSDPSECSQNFLTFPTWFRGLVEVKETIPAGTFECVIKSPNDIGGLSPFILRIVLNVIEIGLQIVVYLTIFFVLFGGFQFLTSAGAPDAAVKARQTIINAAIGFVISLAAIAVVNLIFGIIK